MFWDYQEPPHCGNKHYVTTWFLTSSEPKCFDDAVVCPPKMGTCAPFGKGNYCTLQRTDGVFSPCAEKTIEAFTLIADIAMNIAAMMFTGGASTAAKAAIKTGAEAVAKVSGKAAMRAAAKASWSVGKHLLTNMKKNIIKHFTKDLGTQIIWMLTEEVGAIFMGDKAFKAGWITQDEIIEMIDPTGVAALANFVNSAQTCVYPREMSEQAQMELMAAVTTYKPYFPNAQEYNFLVILNHNRKLGFTCVNSATGERVTFAPATADVYMDCELHYYAIQHTIDQITRNVETLTHAPYSADLNAATAVPSTALDAANTLLGNFDHCKALFDPELRRIGVSYQFSDSARYKHYWTILGKRDGVLNQRCYVNPALGETAIAAMEPAELAIGAMEPTELTQVMAQTSIMEPLSAKSQGAMDVAAGSNINTFVYGFALIGVVTIFYYMCTLFQKPEYRNIVEETEE